MPLRRFFPAFCVLALAAPHAFTASSALADETTDAIRKAERLYRQGNLGKAFTNVEAAVTLVVSRLSEAYAKTFPAAPSGWQRRKPKRGSVKSAYRIGRGFVLQRNYFQINGPGVATAKINIDQQDLIETAQKNLFPNAKHAAAVKRTLVPIKGAGNAFLRFDRSRGVGDLYIFVAGRFYITVSARKVENRAFLTRLLASWDFDGLRRSAGID